MPVTRDMLVSELRDLLRLTAFEQVVATVRRTQARSTPIAEELAANAAKSRERMVLLGQAVRQTGGVPDLVGPALGRVAAVLQTQVNQVQTLQEALLGDLALEHQLRERARYARTLAVSLGEQRVVPVLDRLEEAHTETIGWLETRLAEVGRTGTSAIKATPLQVAFGSARRIAGAPFELAAQGVNQSAGLVSRVLRRAPSAVESAVGTAADVAGSAAERAADVAGTATDAAVGVAGTAAGAAQQVASDVADTAQQVAGTTADAAQQVAGTVADSAQQVAGTTADAAQQVAGTTADAAAQATGAAADAVEATAGRVADLADDTAGGVEGAVQQAAQAVTPEPAAGEVKHPFPGYERLSGDSIIRHVNDTEDVEELHVLLAFEEANKARKGVLGAVRTRLRQLDQAAQA